MNILPLKIYLQITIITISTQIFCNELKAGYSPNVHYKNFKAINLELKNEVEILTKNPKIILYQNNKKLNNWVPKFNLNKRNFNNNYKTVNSRNYEDEKKDFQCLLGKFKSKIFWWTHKNGSLVKNLLKESSYSFLDLSFRKNFNEKSIFNQTVNKLSRLDDHSLIALSVAQNNLVAAPFEALNLVKSTLKFLNLQGNNFYANSNESTWAKFPPMHALLSLDLANCNIHHIPISLFKHFGNLESLSLANNQIMRLPTESFHYLPLLLHLDLSNMNIGEFPSDEDIETIESYIDVMNKGGMRIDEHVFDNLTNLQSLDFSHTRIWSKSTKALYNFGKSLKFLSLCYTSIHVLDNKMFMDTKIKGLDLSGNPYAAYNLNNNSFEVMADSLKILWFAESNLKTIHWLKKLKNIKYLNLAGNNINSLTNQTFLSMKDLKYVDLSMNHIGNWYYQVFQDNSNLGTLNLQENNINMITPEMFKDFKSLNYLALSKNNFLCYCGLRNLIDYAAMNCDNNTTNFTLALDNLNSQNIEIDQYFMDAILTEKYKFQYEESQYNLQMRISTVVNHLDLNNTKVYKFKLLDYNEDDYWCYNGSRYFRLNEISYCPFKKYDQISEELSDLAKYLICGTIVFLIVTIIFIILYNKQMKIKQLLILVKKLFGINSNDEYSDEKKSFKYDVFVSYSDYDREWILQELVPNIDRDNNLKVCLHERDFKVGMTIWENIINNMDKSRSLLLIVSKSFLKSHWCQFEMQFAQKRLFEARKNQLVLILLEDIPNNQRPKCLQYLMEIRTYIKWPVLTGNSEKDAELKTMFWNRIKKSLQND